jgi:hypothetical protein
MMPSRTRLSSTTTQAQAEVIGTLLSGGWLRIFDGDQPSDADDPVPKSSRLLVELQFNEVDGEVMPSLQKGYVRAKGHAGWFRALQSDGETVVMDGLVDTEDADLVLDRLELEQDALIQAIDFRYVPSRQS